jgi:simple sugar transport system ATP-binding protein
MDSSEKRVEMRQISKRFGDVQALDDVDFTLARGEVHTLLGENGAGKTTLMNVLSGLYQADTGEIWIDGQPVEIHCPKDALEHNISMVHQHFELIPQFTALENIILGLEGGKPVMDKKEQKRRVQDLMDRYGLSADLDKKVKHLAIGIQQKVEILKALYRGSSILILDEPTTMLTPQEVDALFSTIRTLTKEGLTVVFISHKIQEVLSVSDRISVMRRGRLVKTLSTSEATEGLLVQLMIGSGEVSLEVGQDRCVSPFRGTVLSVENLGVQDEKEHWLARDVSLEVTAGEIVGLVGVAGNGQREVAEAIYGMRAAREGQIIIRDTDVTEASVRKRLELGVSFLPEDRIRQGVLPNMTLAESLVLGPHHFLFEGSMMFDEAKANQLAREAIEQYQIVAPNERVSAQLLSGGNIQKVIVARALLLCEFVNSTLMIAFNPTRGLDVMSTNFIRDKLIERRNAGQGVLLISEDLDESLLLSDRIYVMHKGRMVGERTRHEYDPYAIGALMVGGET